LPKGGIGRSLRSPGKESETPDHVLELRINLRVQFLGNSSFAARKVDDERGGQDGKGSSVLKKKFLLTIYTAKSRGSGAKVMPRRT